MQKPRTIAASPEGELACRSSRLEALRREMEVREQAQELSRLLAERILELLRLPAVKTISRPGQEPRVVFANAAVVRALPRLIRTYLLLSKLAVEPLPAESALTAGLAESLGVRASGEENEAAQKPAAAAPDPSRATKCNVFQRKRALIDKKPGIEKCA